MRQPNRLAIGQAGHDVVAEVPRWGGVMLCRFAIEESLRVCSTTRVRDAGLEQSWTKMHLKSRPDGEAR